MPSPRKLLQPCSARPPLLPGGDQHGLRSKQPAPLRRRQGRARDNARCPSPPANCLPSPPAAGDRAEVWGPRRTVCKTDNKQGGDQIARVCQASAIVCTVGRGDRCRNQLGGETGSLPPENLLQLPQPVARRIPGGGGCGSRAPSTEPGPSLPRIPLLQQRQRSTGNPSFP